MIDPRDLDEMEEQWNVAPTSYYWELRLLAEVRRLQADCEGWQKLGERTIRAEADRSEIQRMYQRASDEARRYRNALTEILEGRFRYNMGDYETCARNAARLAIEEKDGQ